MVTRLWCVRDYDVCISCFGEEKLNSFNCCFRSEAAISCLVADFRSLLA